MIEFTEEIILNEDFQEKFPGLRRFRIEYGFECGCPEGTIYLPADCNADEIEQFLRSKINFKCPCFSNNHEN